MSNLGCSVVSDSYAHFRICSAHNPGTYYITKSFSKHAAPPFLQSKKTKFSIISPYARWWGSCD